MSDEDNGFSLADESAQDTEQFVGFLGRKHAGRLVHDKDIGRTVQSFEDFDALLQADGQLFNARVRVYGEAILLAELLNDFAGFANVVDGISATWLVTQHDIFGYCQGRDEHEVLVDHTDVQANGIAGSIDANLLPIDENFPAIRVNQPIEDIHKSGFPGAIFTHEGVNFASAHLQVDVIIRYDAGPRFGDIAHFYRQRD
jgi:hypothetical protein